MKPSRTGPGLLFASLAPLLTGAALLGCGSASSKSDASAGGYGGRYGSPADGSAGGYGGSGGYGSADAGGGAGSGGAGAGSFGGVGVGGGQDFAAFRLALDSGKIPSPDSLDATGFFAEHYNALPPPTCGQTFCLHGMLSVSKDLVHGGDWTLLQMGMNSPIDPATVARPPLDLVVVLDRSGSMAGAGKMDYAHQGIKLLIEALGADDTFTLISFDDRVEHPFGPAKIGENKARLETLVDGIAPRGGTDIYAGLEAGYQAALSVGDETQQRRVIFLTDGVATAGITDPARIKDMSAGYNARYAGLSTIGLGSDAAVGLLRALAETGGGNFTFIEKPEAVVEVFTEELAFFVAPIAYDVQLSFEEQPAYALETVYGTNLWTRTPGGGTVSVPSVFLVSRQSSAPGPGGGRRGGGSAIIAELGRNALVPPGPAPVARLHLRYRQPGSPVFQTQDVDVTFDDSAIPDGGYYDNKDVEKNTIILALFVAFRDATALAQVSPARALDLLTAFEPKITGRIEGLWSDDDLQDDLKILARYISVLAKAAG